MNFLDLQNVARCFEDFYFDYEVPDGTRVCLLSVIKSIRNDRACRQAPLGELKTCSDSYTPI